MLLLKFVNGKLSSKLEVEKSSTTYFLLFNVSLHVISKYIKSQIFKEPYFPLKLKI